MSDKTTTTLSVEHREFFERFKSFWAAPSGPRVAEIIAPEAEIHFTGAGTFSGTVYIDFMQEMLDSNPDMKVTALDCAGDGDRLYIYWQTATVVNGAPRKFNGVDRFRLADGMAVEEHIIFDTAALQTSN